MKDLLVIFISDFIIGFNCFTKGCYHLKFTQWTLIDWANWVVDKVWRDKKRKREYFGIILSVFFETICAFSIKDKHIVVLRRAK